MELVGRSATSSSTISLVSNYHYPSRTPELGQATTTSSSSVGKSYHVHPETNSQSTHNSEYSIATTTYMSIACRATAKQTEKKLYSPPPTNATKFGFEQLLIEFVGSKKTQEKLERESESGVHESSGEF